MKHLALFLLFVLMAISCKKPDDRKCWKGWGEDVVSLREPGFFDEIAISGHLEVHLIPSNTTFVQINCGSHLLNEVTTEVNNDVLTIDNLNTCNFLRGYKKQVRVTVGVPQLNHLLYSGTGPVVCDDTIITNNLTVETASGSGDIELLTHCDSAFVIMHASVTGLTVKGGCHYLYTYSSGQSVLSADQFKTDSATVHNRGIGDMHINVSAHLNVSIESKGNVYVSGHPQLGWDIESGEGKIIFE